MLVTLEIGAYLRSRFGTLNRLFLNEFFVVTGAGTPSFDPNETLYGHSVGLRSLSPRHPLDNLAITK